MSGGTARGRSPDRAPASVPRPGSGPHVPVQHAEREASAIALRFALGSSPEGVTPASLAGDARAALARPAPSAPAGDGGVGARLGAALGYDFSGVRLRTDAGAAAAAEAERAHAFATGREVFFAPGRFRPDLPLGRALIAHELVHVAQTGSAPRRGATGIDPEAARLHETMHAEAVTPAEGLRGRRLKMDSCDPVSSTSPPTQSSPATGGATGPSAPPQPSSTPPSAAPPSTAAPAAASAPPTPPASLPAEFASHYADVESAVKALNDRLKPPTPLDPDWIRAMLAVETSVGTDARKYDPMQVANTGDPALPTLQAGGEHSALLDPGLAAKLKGKKTTPRRDGKWDYASMKASERMDAATGILAGVAWLAVKAANFTEVTVESGPELTHTVAAGDTYPRLAKQLGTTVDTLAKYNPEVNPSRLQVGRTVLTYRAAHREWKISGWKSWEKATEDYNGGGDPDYLAKVKAKYDQIKKATAPAATP